MELRGQQHAPVSAPTPGPAQAKEKPNTLGPTSEAIPPMDWFAPCSWPCSLGPTWRVISPCSPGVIRPESELNGMHSR